MSPAAERRWLATLAYVEQTVLADHAVAGNPLVTGQTARLLAAAALATFPGTTMGSEPRGPGQVAPAAMRRAMAYVEAHATGQVSMTEMAAAAGSESGRCNTPSVEQDITPAG
ncbi:hypothetical protein [Micromonospora coerulea]|uniref:hypothetical protein n=1 Tax=Micromonospora coerulea TaxID=47856 RepID=UPI00190802F0|nr:hypothetical protein [Micromonospora veneta]